MYKEKLLGRLAVEYDSNAIKWLPRLRFGEGWTFIAGPIMVDWIKPLKCPVCYDCDFNMYNCSRWTVFDTMRESGHLVDGIRLEFVAHIIVKVANRLRIKQDRIKA